MSSTSIKIEIRNFTDFSMKEGTFLLQKGENVLSVLIEQRVFDMSHCGGRGTCGKCTVRFLQGAPLPMPADRRRFSPQELRDGYRLACMARPQQDCEIELLFAKKQELILDETFLDGTVRGDTVRGEAAARGNAVWGEAAARGNAVQNEAARRMVVGDIGTTTIVLQLVEIGSGRVVDTQKMLNPQRKYGADVVSRMQSALDGHLAELSEMVHICVDTAVTNWQQDGYAIERIVLAGNTVMMHLYMKFDMQGISKAPFIPMTQASVPVEVHGVRGCFLPLVSAFVGGDIVAGILACKEQMRREQVDTALLIDLGTNGEIAVIGKENILCTATAAGPAFEGVLADVWGSQLIEIAAKLRTDGIVDENGLMCEPYFSEGVIVETAAGTVKIWRKDIRSLQTAKAAVYAGIRILLEEYGISGLDVERVYVAGGFGYQTNIEAACQIGLLPSEFAQRTKAVGNTALAGAYLYGKRLAEEEYAASEMQPPEEKMIEATSEAQPTEMFSTEEVSLGASTVGTQQGMRGSAAGLLGQITSLNLAEHEKFNEIYLESMTLQQSK